MSTTATFSAVGTYVLRLSVSDSLLTATDNVTVTDANEAPTSSADSSVRTEGGNSSGFLNVLSNHADVEGGPLTVARLIAATCSSSQRR